MTHLAHDFWSRRYIVVGNHGVNSAWEIIAVTDGGLVAVGNWPGSSDSRYGTRTILWDDVKAWYADPNAAAAHSERLNAKKPS
jgi:hypothetical protein